MAISNDDVMKALAYVIEPELKKDIVLYIKKETKDFCFILKQV